MQFNPSASLYKETLSETEQVPVGNSTGSAQFGMLPKDVMRRRDISGTAKVILSGMAMESYGTGFISMSHQALALICGCSRSQVLACLKQLVAVGLLRKDGEPVKQVQPYELVHPKFRHGHGKVEPAAMDMRKHSGRELRICPECQKLRRGVMRVGWCRSCNAVKKTEKIARRISREEIAAEKIA